MSDHEHGPYETTAATDLPSPKFFQRFAGTESTMSFKRISGFTSLSVIMWVTAFCLTPSASAQLPWPTPYKDPFYNNDFS